MQYFKLTDTVNFNTIIRVDKAQQEVYNTGTAQWEPTPLFIIYSMPGSVYEGLYKEITKQEAEDIILQNKNEWVRYWNIALSLIANQYTKLKSPIKEMYYSDYIQCIADLAVNSQERVLLGLSGLPLLPKWREFAAKQNLPQVIINALSLWHTDKIDLHRISNAYILRPRLKELTYLVGRGDLANPDKYKRLHTSLSTEYKPDELYFRMEDWH